MDSIEKVRAESDVELMDEVMHDEFMKIATHFYKHLHANPITPYVK